MTWLMHMWHDPSIRIMNQSYVICLIHTWHVAFICGMTHSYVTWLIHVWHDSFTSDLTHSYVTWRIYVRVIVAGVHPLHSSSCSSRLLLLLLFNAPHVTDPTSMSHYTCKCVMSHMNGPVLVLLHILGGSRRGGGLHLQWHSNTYTDESST